MKTVSWTLENGMNCCDLEGEVEVEDNATKEDIEDAVREDIWNFLSLSYVVKAEKDEAPAPSPAQRAP